MGIDIIGEFCPYTFLTGAEIPLEIFTELIRLENSEAGIRLML